VSASCSNVPASIGDISLLSESCGSGQAHSSIRACMVGNGFSRNSTALLDKSATGLTRDVRRVGSTNRWVQGSACVLELGRV
jgi:hypothetical protein